MTRTNTKETGNAPVVPRLFSPAALADLGAPSPDRQAKLRMAGKFCPHIRIGGRIFYMETDWAEFLNNNRRNSTADDGAQRAA